MQNIINIMNSLADENRLRLFMSLNGRELCVCQLVDFIGLADSTVSKHMSILKQAGLVESRKCGKWVYYKLAGENASPLIRQIVDLILSQLQNDSIMKMDSVKIVDMLEKTGASACHQETGNCSESANIESSAVLATN